MSLASVKRRWFLPLGIAIVLTSIILLFLGQPSGMQLYIAMANAFLFASGTLIVFFIYYYFQIERKRILLEYHVKPDVAVLTTNPSEKNNSDAFFNINDGNFCLITLKIKNSGNTAITPRDFVRELTLNFGEDAEILEVDVLESKPGNVQLKYTKETHRLLIESVFLNSKNFVKVAVLLRGLVDNVLVNGEITGTKQKVVRV